MISFELFLEMALMRRDAIEFDEGDVNYLQQFPQRMWRTALAKRYSDFLLAALDRKGKLKRNWNDIQDVTISAAGGPVTFKDINTGISDLVQKLKYLKFDLSDPDHDTKTLARFKLMRLPTASVHLSKWIKQANGNIDKTFTAYRNGRPVEIKSSNADLPPGYQGYTPNKSETGENSIDDPYEANAKWNTIKDDVVSVTNRLIDQTLNSLSNPDHTYHINYYYWRERKEELLKKLLDFVKKNLADDWVADIAKRNHKIAAKIGDTVRLVGHVTRRNVESGNHNVQQLLKQGYSIDQIIQMFNQNIRKRGRPAYKGQEQPSPLVQATELPNSPISRYQSNTIANLRQKQSMQNMANKQSDERYLLKRKPKISPEAYPLRKAASDISSQVESFKEWLRKYESLSLSERGV